MGTKLIEVSLPLDDINKAAAREKSIRHGHPSTLHLWWARRPLAAARAVLFSSIVDDPSDPDYRWRDEQTRERSAEEIDAERQRLHDMISRMVPWEASNDEAILKEVRAEILWHTRGDPPPVMDPFAGGGSIPLEAQRLGLEAHASDLNPVAVLINKALIEIPPKFAGRPPVNPDAQRDVARGVQWKGAAGLATDVRYYGKWMRDEAERRIGHLYPKVRLPAEQGGGEATVIAWLWARTVTCPNPACGSTMPLVSSFWLSKKVGKTAWVVPHPEPGNKRVRFSVDTGDGQAPDAPKLGRGAKFKCLICGQAATEQHIKREGAAKRMGSQLMATVAQGKRGRLYLAPDQIQAETALQAAPTWRPSQALANDPRNLWCIPYGLTTFGDLFTDRQLVALTTLSNLIGEVRERIEADATRVHSAGVISHISADNDMTSYANSVATYLALGLSRLADISNTLCLWSPSADQAVHMFGRQAIPMTWDYAETQPFSRAAGDFGVSIESIAKSLAAVPAAKASCVTQKDASSLTVQGKYAISTDPPYYDNIGYADLSDFFYVWLRRSSQDFIPEILRTVMTPKNTEMIATPYRHGGNKDLARSFFESGLQSAWLSMRESQDHDFPLTVYYAFKQEESTALGDNLIAASSTGWETMLEGLIRAGYQIGATWPMRTERSGRMIGIGANALASSIVLACRVRDSDASSVSRNDFLRELRRALPGKLRAMQYANIAPVDLAQAAIGPGMAIYSSYSGILNPDGSKMRVRAALQLINQVLDDVLADQDGEYDRETGWALAWFGQQGMAETAYGTAETLANARNVSVRTMETSGIVASGGGKVRLLRRDELQVDWLPAKDHRLTDWECVQYLIRELEGEKGQRGAADLMRLLGARAEISKDLAYRLYVIAERKGWAKEALAYNGLVVAWPDISRLVAESPGDATGQLAFATT